MKNRKAFNFYRSYYEVAMELPLEERALFLTALLQKQFEDIEPSLEGMVKFAYLSQKHSINSQVEGFKNKKGIDPSEPPSEGGNEPPYEPPSKGDNEPPSVQEKEKVKEKGKVKEKEKSSIRSSARVGELDIFDLDFTSTEANDLADKFLKEKYNV